MVRGDDEHATFERARSLGPEGVEVMLTRQQLRDKVGRRLSRLREAQTATGVEIPSLMLPEHNSGGLARSESSLAQAAREDIAVALEWAGELGARAILVPFFFGNEISTEADFQRVAQALRELCPIAEQLGIQLCYEGTLPSADIRRLAEQVQSPGFGCYFDLANVVWRGLDTATEIRALGELITQVHLKDTRVGPGDCHPGLGRVDYAVSASALREVGYNGWIMLETPAGPLELVTRDVSFTRRWFPSIPPTQAWPRLGNFSYDFRRGELDRLITTFTSQGLGAVQLGGDLLDEALENPESIPAIRGRLDEAGITVAALAGYRNLVAPDPDKRVKNLAFLKRCLELAPQFGTSIVATETGTLHAESDWLPTHSNWGDEAWAALHAAVEELLPVAEQHGSVLALEGYVNNVLQTPGQLLGLLERYPSEHLQVVLDPFNYLSSHMLPAQSRAVADFLARFEHRFVLAHLKDVGAEGAEKDTPEYGYGVFDYGPYLEFLRTHRPDLPIILEHLPLDHVPAAVNRLREAIAGLPTQESPIEDEAGPHDTSFR